MNPTSPSSVSPIPPQTVHVGGLLNSSMSTTNSNTMTAANNNNNNSNKPFVRIVEQPAKCAIRFRYECEGRSAGSIPGVKSSAENKSYPTIQVCNYRGKAVVVVSCVTKDPPYRPHPHNLVGKEGCKKGVCTIVIDNNSDMTCTFTSLGIQCVKRKDIEESLKLRELIKVDPFRTGFNHRSQASNIDLNVVRLCFQVFIEGPEKGKFTVQLPPVVSEAIYDKKAMAELIIIKLSHYSAPCTGGKEIILLCDRVAKDDIQVRFFHESSGQGLIWEAYGDFLPNDVHKQVAISLRTPKYFDENISQPVTVQIQLRRPSDGCMSLSRSFQLTPRELDPDGLVRKRHKRLKEENYDLLQEYIQLASRSGATSFGAKSSLSAVANVKSEMSTLLSAPAQPSQPLNIPQATIPASSSHSPNRSQFCVSPVFQQSPQHGANFCTNDSPQNRISPKSPIQFTSSVPVTANHPNTILYSPVNVTSQEMMNAEYAPVMHSPSANKRRQSPLQSHPNSIHHQHLHHQTNSQPTFTSSSVESNDVSQHLQQQQQFLSVTNSSPAYQQQSSPNPSYHSPSPIATNTNNNNNFVGQTPPLANNNGQELPNEVMERFDSLDIDSSELIPYLDLNSNTMLTLLMDTSSGLSLSDNFSDYTNNNLNNPDNVDNNGGGVGGNNNDNYTGEMSNMDTRLSRMQQQRTNGSKLRLNLEQQHQTTVNNNVNNAMIGGDQLDTPTIDLTPNLLASTGDGGPMLSVYDIDQNTNLNQRLA